jgi:rSAM/selenodomain-associated transferase 1
VPAVLVMAKAPVAGQVKTRLGPLFSPAQCAAIQRRLIDRTLDWAQAVAPGAAFLAFDPPAARVQMEATARGRAVLFEQAQGDLGSRLVAASREAFGRVDGALVVVGVDTRLTVAHAAAALAQLDAGADLVLGPALDGGYYLAGMSRPAPGLFELPAGAWGGPQVLSLTLAAARAAGLSVALISEERDLDTPEDAAAMQDDPELGDLLRPVLAARARPA